MSNEAEVPVQCGHPKWVQCDCAKPMKDAYRATIGALNALADEFVKWGHGLPHDRSCTSFEIGYCSCSVHDAMRTLGAKHTELSDAIEMYKSLVYAER